MLRFRPRRLATTAPFACARGVGPRHAAVRSGQPEDGPEPCTDARIIRGPPIRLRSGKSYWAFGSGFVRAPSCRWPRPPPSPNHDAARNSPGSRETRRPCGEVLHMSRQGEASLACRLLNRMTELGRHQSSAISRSGRSPPSCSGSAPSTPRLDEVPPRTHVSLETLPTPWRRSSARWSHPGDALEPFEGGRPTRDHPREPFLLD